MGGDALVSLIDLGAAKFSISEIAGLQRVISTQSMDFTWAAPDASRVPWQA